MNPCYVQLIFFATCIMHVTYSYEHFSTFQMYILALQFKQNLYSFLYLNKNLHWYIEVLYKQLLTPFCDDNLNCHLVRDCDRGVLPTRPRNRRGYALLAHTLDKMRSCATSERSNTVIHTIVLKIQLYRRNRFRS
mgnify:CR=1 FL=1